MTILILCVNDWSVQSSFWTLNDAESQFLHVHSLGTFFEGVGDQCLVEQANESVSTACMCLLREVLFVHPVYRDNYRCIEAHICARHEGEGSEIVMENEILTCDHSEGGVGDEVNVNVNELEAQKFQL